MSNVIKSEQRTARKTHRCNYCCLPILPGTTYDVSTISYDGGLYKWKSHLDCIEVADKLDMYSQCDEGVTDEDFHEYVNNEYDRIIAEDESLDSHINDFAYRLMIVKNYHEISIKKVL